MVGLFVFMDFNYASYKDSPLHAINDTQDEGLQTILLNSLLDTSFFAKTFLGDNFEDKNTYQHNELWSLIDDDTVPRYAACIWRGFGKTTMHEAKMIKNTCFRLTKFNLVVGAVQKSAIDITESMKSDFIENDKIREVFGKMEPRSVEGMTHKQFGKDSYFIVDAKTGQPITYFVPRGAQQSVRGIKVNIYGKRQRPDFIYIDDLEDDEGVLNEEVRQKVRYWVNNALIKCVPRVQPSAKNLWVPKSDDPKWRPPWRVAYADTLKHEDAMMAYLLESAAWKSVRFPQAEKREDGKWHSLVPEIVSTAQIRNSIKNEEADGTFDGWCREMLCLPIPPSGDCWTTQLFQYYSDAESKLSSKPNVDRFVIVDPARTANTKSAYTAILAVAFDGKHIYVRDLINERLSPDEIVDRSFEMALATKSQSIWIETTGLSEWLQHPYENERSRRGLFDIEVCWLKSKSPHGDFGTGKDAAKRARAASVLPYYRKKLVYHENILKNSALEQQQLSFPRPKKWDALDCCGYIPFILQESGRYVEPDIEKSKDKDGVMRDDFDRMTKDISSRNWELCGSPV